MSIYKKGIFFGNAIGFVIGCLLTNIYIDYNYILIPTNMRDIVQHIHKNKYQIKK